MDGVERVMVLGILAVIIAILSFAWNATEEGPLPAVLGGPGSSAITLSSQAPTTPGVIMPRPGLHARLQDGGRVAQDQDRLRNQLLGRVPDESALPFDGNPLMGETQIPGPAGRAAQNQPPLQLPVVVEGAPAGSQGSQPGQEGEAGAVPGADEPVADGDVSELVPTYDSRGRRIEYEPVHLSPDLESAGPGAAATQAASTAAFKLYTVVEGDTLWNISSRQTASGGDTKQMIERIQALNPGLDAQSLSVGRTIKLPGKGAAAPVVQAQAPESQVPAVQAAPVEGGRVYVVQDGDTLGEIARRELGDGRLWKDIYALNRALIGDPEHIRTGQRLVLPGG